MTDGQRLLAACVWIVGVLVALSGCAAGIAGAILYEKWDDWFKNEKVDDYTIYVDGYDYGKAPDPSGLLNLTGLSEGDYLITVTKPPTMRSGVHATAHIVPGRPLDMTRTNLFQGGVIRGSVRRDGPGGPVMANMRVIAVRNAARLLSAGSEPITIPQPAGSTIDYMMGYTNSAGEFTLGPTLYGDWLVFVAAAGYAADVEYVRVASGTDGEARLYLVPISEASVGLVRGTVNTRDGAGARYPLVTAKLETPFEPVIDHNTQALVEGRSGLNMPDGPWFRLLTLTTVGSDSGQFYLDLPAGTHTLEAFKYPYRATSEAVSVPAGGITNQDFTLLGS